MSYRVNRHLLIGELANTSLVAHLPLHYCEPEDEAARKMQLSSMLPLSIINISFHNIQLQTSNFIDRVLLPRSRTDITKTLIHILFFSIMIALGADRANIKHYFNES